MTDTPVIYERPKHPLPDKAKYLFWCHRNIKAYAAEKRPNRYDTGFAVVAGAHWEVSDIYYQPGTYWKDSLRRIVRLSEKAYYTPENPHTTGKGLLPHDGGVMPKWLEGKTVVVKLRDGAIHGPRGASAYMWCKSPCDHTSGDIIAYRIVGEQKEQEESDPVTDFKAADLDEVQKEAERIAEGTKGPGLQTGGVLPSDGVLPRTPSDATYPREAVQRAYEHGLRDGRASRDERYAASLDPSCKPRSPSDAAGHQYQDVYTEDERRHRNEIAARTLTPVPGMDEWMHDVIREARRHDFRVAALEGLLANTTATEPHAFGGDPLTKAAAIYAEQMLARTERED